MAYRHRTLLAAACLLCALAQAQTATQPYAAPAFADAGRAERVAALLPELDKMYAALAAAEHLPGLVYGVVLDGKLVHTRSLGFADLERKVAVTSATQFRIASMTKSFVAMAVLRLRDEGKLGLDDPVSKYLPELAGLRLPTADSPPLTVRNLMTMSTGLPEDNPWGDRQMEISNAALEQFVRAGLSFANVPDQQFEYSNLGFVLLGKVVSTAACVRYQDYITKHILRPLGMHSTHWEFAQAPPGRLALGYRWEHGAWQREPILHDGDGAAMGGLITTMDDFARYVAFHLSAWPARDDADHGPLRRASVRAMHQPRMFAGAEPNATIADDKSPNPRITFYGYGLTWTRDGRGVVTVGHSGGLPGYGSQYRFAPEHGIGVIAFSNLRYGPVYGPTSKALNTMLERASLPPRAIMPSAILATRQRQVAQLIQTWDAGLGAAIAADNFFLDRARADWIALARERFEQIGKVTAIGPLKPENQLRGSFTVSGERGALDVSFTLTPEREPKLQELAIKPAAQP
jgi:CubicO group peptidase (beta-lactamase class C family)